MRPLTNDEETVLRLLSERLPTAAKKQLLDDMEECRVTEETSDGSLIEFILKDYSRPPYKGQHAYPVEGAVMDRDGADMSVCIYADQNDRLLEFEIIRYEEGDVLEPQWQTFQITT